MSEHILVTGGAGFIGSHLVDALLERGHRVRILDSLEPQVHGSARKPPDYLKRDAEFIRGSILDREAVSRALTGIDVVFHQAALVGVGQSMYDIGRYCEVNTVGTGILLEEVIERRDSVRKMVVASSMSVYGEGAYRAPDGTMRYPRLRSREALARGEWEMRDAETGERLESIPTPETKPLHPTSVYAITKRDHEELFLSVGFAYQIPAVALRYFNVYGDRQALSNPYTGVAAIFSSRILNGTQPIVFEDGEQSRDFTHVSDIVQANVLALESDATDYEAFNVGTGRPHTVVDVGRMLAEHLNRPELSGEKVGKFREGDIRHCYADISKIRDLLGFEPVVSIQRGVSELVEWVQEQTAIDLFDEAHRELAARGLAWRIGRDTPH